MRRGSRSTTASSARAPGRTARPIPGAGWRRAPTCASRSGPTTAPAIGLGLNVSPYYVCTTTPKPPPPAAEPTIYWSRTSGPPGTHFTLTGNGWVPGGTVRVHLPSNFYGSVSWHVNSRGGRQQKFTAGDTAPRDYTLRFSETSGHLLVTGSFRVLVGPRQ